MPAGSHTYEEEDSLQPPALGRIQSETGTAPTHGYGDTRHLDGTVMFSWIKDIESRIVTIEENKKREENEALERAKPDNLEELMLQMESEVRDCNWEQFKNRYSEPEARYAIETLVASDDLAGEMEAEQLNRISPAKRRPYTLTPRKPVRQTQTGKTKDQRLERVRINSAIVLAYLAKVTGQFSWSKKPHTFLKPFKVLIHYHDKMEHEFQELEKKFGGSQESTAEPPKEPEEENENSNQASVDKGKAVDDEVAISSEPHDNRPPTTAPIEVPPSDELPQSQEATITPQEVSEEKPLTTDYEEILRDAMDSKKGYEDMRCYMDFARSRLLTLYHAFDKADYDHPAKIRFDDIWSLFRVGELVYQRTDAGTDVAQPGSDGPRAPQNAPRLFRIYFTWQDIPYWIVEDLETNDAKLRRDADFEPGDTRVACYYIDYDGKSYGGVPHLFDIEPYEGEKDITKLPIYPIRFAKDSEKILKDLKERGQRFTEFISKKDRALAHNGWTLTIDPAGDDIEDGSGNSIRFPQHIDSDVVIDFQEAYQANPWWKPNFPKFVPGQYRPVNLIDSFAVIQWSGKDRYEPITKIEEVVVSVDDVYRLEWNAFAATDEFIVEQDDRRDHDDTKQEVVKQDLSDEDLALLPSRLFVYALRERKFVNADIKCLKPIKPLERPFDNLKIEEKHKEMIQSIVFEHFEKKKLQKKAADTNRELSDQDFIRGKGKGLVILLHGAPGVGKTATAEALSYVYNKPLFPITCGDLGIEPEDVEENLSEIFRLANLWDCMLLLDEAEIFLSHREKKDDNLQRNALVSSMS
ncbi:putative aaa family protein [Phaeoacremonium minimum UCRPA7]|uniref:Putative aaa family protein n=1 Tax=Phaeoacremonium minimum (strain UCR-PA7) TaxID=1286976 RepID=R8BTL4_PHAM7|nr:putative aaa family protein [Phaeoacremonium minimum UCRPA7]EOO02738.1 putative aaa family protein [Phaeoacremonium minimum UCRPA7]